MKRKRNIRYAIYTLLVAGANILSIKPGYPLAWPLIAKYTLYGFQIVASSIDVMGFFVLFIYNRSTRPWKKDFKDYKDILSKKPSRKNLRLVATILSILLKIFILISLILMILVWGISFGWWPHNLAVKINAHLPPNSREMLSIISIFLLICMWNLRSQQKRIYARRNGHDRDTISKLRSLALKTNDTTSKNKIDTIKRDIADNIKETMRNALMSTQYGLHKKLLRAFNTIFLFRKLGPKSIWLFFPNDEKNYFDIIEYTCIGDGNSIYARLCDKYHPKIVQQQAWETEYNRLHEQVENNVISKKDAKKILFKNRYDYGSDIGIISSSEDVEGKCLWSIDYTCTMHDSSYHDLLESHRPTHCFRSSVLVPIMYPDNGANKPVLALFSPAPCEFDQRDALMLQYYADTIAILLAHYERVGGKHSYLQDHIANH